MSLESDRMRSNRSADRVPIGGAMKNTHGALNSCFFQAWDIDAFTDVGDFTAAADSLLSGPHRRGRCCHSTLSFAVIRSDSLCTNERGTIVMRAPPSSRPARDPAGARPRARALPGAAGRGADGGALGAGDPVPPRGAPRRWGTRRWGNKQDCAGFGPDCGPASGLLACRNAAAAASAAATRLMTPCRRQPLCTITQIYVVRASI